MSSIRSSNDDASGGTRLSMATSDFNAFDTLNLPCLLDTSQPQLVLACACDPSIQPIARGNEAYQVSWLIAAPSLATIHSAPHYDDSHLTICSSSNRHPRTKAPRQLPKKYPHHRQHGCQFQVHQHRNPNKPSETAFPAPDFRPQRPPSEYMLA